MKDGPPANSKIRFRKLLLDWHRSQNRRIYSWTGEKDPYRVWLREIILQQTRVEQGLSYYEKFTKTYPSLEDLAVAADDEVFRLWEGLGYYSRCRNLLHTARTVARERNGRFPQTAGELAHLKGIGPYTAAAISSFAFGLPHAVVDGNVYRVLSRVFGISKPVDSSEGKRYFGTLAQDLIALREPAEYNQAIMDFGATVCKPEPGCGDCVFSRHCVARREGSVRKLPLKSKKTDVRERWFRYLVISCRGRVAIRQRVETDIWKGLYEFPMLEGKTNFPEIRRIIPRHAGFRGEVVMKQRLSHQVIHAAFTRVTLNRSLQQNWQWVPAAALSDYSFPRIIRRFIDSGL
ncbi:MAG TPA: A/G-specific adenine glycosylase [Chitinophagaceae bacterium]|nr:A/G-specific adenine glycosylase [Chitinophagaceae bacterium]